jgi:hypothetical protein
MTTSFDTPTIFWGNGYALSGNSSSREELQRLINVDCFFQNRRSAMINPVEQPTFEKQLHDLVQKACSAADMMPGDNIFDLPRRIKILVNDRNQFITTIDKLRSNMSKI